jgi:hypothetical protein
MVTVDYLLLLFEMAPLVGPEQLAPVVDPDLVLDHADCDRVASEAAARVIPGASEVDPAVDVHAADVIVPLVGDRLALLDPSSAPVSCEACGPARLNRSIGTAIPRAWCGLSVF